jgi:hypothetical protein
MFQRFDVEHLTEENSRKFRMVVVLTQTCHSERSEESLPLANELR